MKKLIAIILCIISMTACKSSKETTAAPVAYSPSEQQIKYAQTRWVSATVADLTEGHKIYTKQCNRCHENFPVEKFTEKKWLHEIDAMAPKASLSAEEKEKLTRYLLSMRDTKVSPVKN